MHEMVPVPVSKPVPKSGRLERRWPSWKIPHLPLTGSVLMGRDNTLGNG